MQLHELSGLEISKKIKAGELSVQEVADYFVERIKTIDKDYNSVINLFDEPVIPQEVTDSPLYGVPVLIKDNMNIQGKPLTCASNILKGYIAPYDAQVIEKIKQAGMVILGSVNMDEFAFGSSCETSCYGPTKNPWDKTRVPGGSSGGSAAAVGLGLVPITLGSDTGGSIRQPAAFCGVTGLKPTYGRVSRFGLVAFGSSLDQIGPFSRDIKDSAAMLSIIAGKDHRDSTSADKDKQDYAELDGDIKGLRIGIPKEYFIDGLDEVVRTKVDEVKKFYQDKGAEIVEVSLPHTEYAVGVYYILASSEASTNLSRFDGIRYGARQEQEKLLETYRVTRSQGFGKEAKRRIMLGTFSLSSGYYDAYYGKAQKVRTLIKQDFVEVFKKCDLLLSPTSPTPPFELGAKAEDPISMYLSDIFTIPANLAGIPALSVPCGFTDSNLPIAFQLLGNYFDEKTLFNAAYAYQQQTTCHKEFPEGL